MGGLLGVTREPESDLKPTNVVLISVLHQAIKLTIRFHPQSQRAGVFLRGATAVWNERTVRVLVECVLLDEFQR